MRLIVKENFKWAHRGVDVKEYEEGAEIETEDQDLIDVSTAEGWTAPADGEAPPAEPLPAPDASQEPAVAPDAPPAKARAGRGSRAKQ